MPSPASQRFWKFSGLGRWGVMMVLVLAAADAPAAEEVVRLPATFAFAEDRDNGTMTVTEGARPVLVYNFADRLKPGLPADRKRSCYVHPIYGLDGETLTEDFPPEGHFHHRGLCWAWAEVKVDGRLTDPWDLRGIRARFRKWTERRGDFDSAVLGVEDEWVLDERQVVATEVLSFKVYKATDVGRAIDVQWRVEPKVTLEVAGRTKAGYGGLIFRFSALKQTTITTDQGPQPTDTNQKPCVWADLSSRFGKDDNRSGAAVFLHPRHPGTPVGWTLRHYGLLNPAWPGPSPVKLVPGTPLVLEYRLWIHRGDAAMGRVKQAYEAYAKKPVREVNRKAPIEP